MPRQAAPGKRSYEISGFAPTAELLTGRAGLALFVQYLRQLHFLALLERPFGRLRRSRKGEPVASIFLQLICFFVDGTSRHLTWFDQLKQEGGYAAVLGVSVERLLSSHSVKRFLAGFSPALCWQFRPLLHYLFCWRLQQAKPAVVVLHLDAVVLANDEAKRRHGVQPTYKQVNGFAPLQLSWGPYIVDAVLRGGKRHSNHADTAVKMLEKIVTLIRAGYSRTAPIVVCLDSGFYDEQLFAALAAREHVGFVCAGKRYEDILTPMRELAEEELTVYRQSEDEDATIWGYREFTEQRACWWSAYRGLYLRTLSRDGQGLLALDDSTERVLVTNLGLGTALDDALREAGRGDLLTGAGIIAVDHDRGNGELVWRAMKDFLDQRLPCLRFLPNMAWYYTGLLAFDLYEAFKRDVLAGVVPSRAYPTTVRRQVFDLAGKIVRHGGKVLLKVARATCQRLRLDQLWQRASAPPSLAIATT
jgi:hypothetical protein